MKLKHLLMVCLMLTVLTIGAASAVDGAEELKLADGAADANLTLDEPNANSFESIQVEVNNAKENGIINLEGYYEGSGKQIKVSKSLTFSGSDNAVLDAKYKSDIFYAPNPVNLTFKNITFVNTEDFSILTNWDLGGFNVHVVNCTFKNNPNIAIAAYGASLVVEDSIFADNCQAIQNHFHRLIVNNCSFINNSFVAIRSSEASISNSSFMGNGNKKDGIGAIRSGETIKISNCEFIDNVAFENGGAINIWGSVSISESIFKNNWAKYLGGALYVEDYNLYLDNCLFINNSAFNGAAIYSLKSKLNVRNSNFTDNHARYSIIYAKTSTDFNNVTFKGNTNYTIISSKVNLVNCNSISKTINKWTCLDDDLNVSDFIMVSSNKIFHYYQSGKKLTVKLINTKDNSAVGNCKVKVVLKKGKKTYIKHLTTNSKGIASFDITRYNVGFYKLIVSVEDSNLSQLSVEEIGDVVIYEMSPKVKAPKVSFKYKKSKYFKVTIKHKKTKKPIKGLKIKLKVYTGKKYKVYKIKTNKKGVAKLKTKKLKCGKHKVIITSLNKNYVINKKSLIKIK